MSDKLFDFIQSQVPDSADKQNLTLHHFQPLAELLELNLDDLSLYLLFWKIIYFESEDYRAQPYLISKPDFTRAVDQWAGSQKERAGVCRAIRKVVTDADGELRNDPQKTRAVSFARFLYQWTDVSTERHSARATNEESVSAAIELWTLLFYDESQKNALAPFCHYVQFNQKERWVEFVRSNQFMSRYKITLDLFTCLVKFAGYDITTFNLAESVFPNSIDAFVEYVRENPKKP